MDKLKIQIQNLISDWLYNWNLKIPKSQLEMLTIDIRKLTNSNKMNLDDYAKQSHYDNKQWWIHIETGEPLVRNKGELIALMHSELSECLEGVRKNKMDNHLPHRKMEHVELVDALIRIFDYAGAEQIPLEEIYQEKRAYNKQREDHKAENRKLQDGKKF